MMNLSIVVLQKFINFVYFLFNALSHTLKSSYLAQWPETRENNYSSNVIIEFKAYNVFFGAWPIITIKNTFST